MNLQLAAILPLAVVHTLGNLFTNMSLGKVAVSFTHTIKAMEPFFSVILSAMFLGEVSSLVLHTLYIDACQWRFLALISREGRKHVLSIYFKDSSLPLRFKTIRSIY